MRSLLAPAQQVPARGEDRCMLLLVRRSHQGQGTTLSEIQIASSCKPIKNDLIAAQLRATHEVSFAGTWHCNLCCVLHVFRRNISITNWGQLRSDPDRVLGPAPVRRACRAFLALKHAAWAERGGTCRQSSLASCYHGTGTFRLVSFTSSGPPIKHNAPRNVPRRSSLKSGLQQLTLCRVIPAPARSNGCTHGPSLRFKMRRYEKYGR